MIPVWLALIPGVWLIPVWLALIPGVWFAALFFCIFKALQALSRPAQEKTTQEKTTQEKVTQEKVTQEKVDFVPQYSAEDIKAGLELAKSILAIHEEQRQEEIEAKKQKEDPKMTEYALKKDRIEELLDEEGEMS